MSHVYSDRMSSQPMGWSETGADAMCQLRCYVRDYGEERIIDLVHYRRKHKETKAAGAEEMPHTFERGYMQKLLYGQHDNDMVYIEKMQATIPSVEIPELDTILIKAVTYGILTIGCGFWACSLL